MTEFSVSILNNNLVGDNLTNIPTSEHTTIEDLHNLRLKLLSEGSEVYDLSMINPDISPDRILIDKLVQASLKKYHHRYGVSRGLKKLREAFSEKYHTTFNIKLDPSSEVCVTQGCKDGILQVLKTSCKQGDNVLLLSPAYPAYIYAINYLGLNCLTATLEETEEKTIEGITEALSKNKIRVLLLNFPHNPTGKVVSENFWSKVKSISAKHNLLVVNDFTYGEMVYSGEPATSLLNHSQNLKGCVEIYSLSKSYSVPGWRVAGLVGDREVVASISKLKSQIDYGIFLPIQLAAAYALCSDNDLVSMPREMYHRRSKILCDNLSGNGWDILPPLAGTCVWARMPSRIKNKLPGTQRISYQLSKLMLSESHVFGLPGEYFGEQYGEYARFALVLPEDKIRTAALSISTL